MNDKDHVTSNQRPFQGRVVDWMMETFSMEVCRNTTERNHRFLEEALELVQAMGCTAAEAHMLVDYTFGRPVGEPEQEVGGAMVTLAALCAAADISMAELGERELARCWQNIVRIRAKQAGKPRHSPLPGPTPDETTPESAPFGWYRGFSSPGSPSEPPEYGWEAYVGEDPPSAEAGWLPFYREARVGLANAQEWHRLCEAIATILEVDSNADRDAMGRQIADAIQRLRDARSSVEPERPLTVLRDCWSCGTGMDLDQKPEKCLACGAADPCGVGPKQVKGAASHTTENDFQHWLSYSGVGASSDADLRAAYYAGANMPPAKRFDPESLAAEAEEFLAEHLDLSDAGLQFRRAIQLMRDMLACARGAGPAQEPTAPRWRHDWETLPGPSYRCKRCSTSCLDAHAALLCVVEPEEASDEYCACLQGVCMGPDHTDKLCKAEKASAIQCVWRSKCKNQRLCEEAGCCQQLGA